MFCIFNNKSVPAFPPVCPCICFRFTLRLRTSLDQPQAPAHPHRLQRLATAESGPAPGLRYSFSPNTAAAAGRVSLGKQSPLLSLKRKKKPCVMCPLAVILPTTYSPLTMNVSYFAKIPYESSGPTENRPRRRSGESTPWSQSGHSPPSSPIPSKQKRREIRNLVS